MKSGGEGTMETQWKLIADESRKGFKNLARTTWASRNGPMDAPPENIYRILSTDALIKLEHVPACVASDFPADLADPPKTNLPLRGPVHMYQYGWMKEVRENHPGENGMRIITQVWKYGLWMTGNVPRL